MIPNSYDFAPEFVMSGLLSRSEVVSSWAWMSRRTFVAMSGWSMALARGRSPHRAGAFLRTRALTKDLTGTVTAVAKMGYEVVEFYAPYFDWTPQRAMDVRKLLDDLGIRCNSTHNDYQSVHRRGFTQGD
jgi:hypothetical protein